MIVERLRTRHFRNLGDFDLAFAPGLTIIRGPNEAGKSSIVSALLTVLFVRANTAAQSVLEQKDWDHDQPFTIQATFRHGDQRFELVKDFAARTQTLHDLSTDQIVKDASAIEKQLTALLGCPSQAFFESTACIKHDELAMIAKDKNALPQRLQQLVTGPDDANVTSALESLHKYLTDLDRGLVRPAHNPGLVCEARQRVRTLEEKRKGALASLKQRDTWQKESRQLGEEIKSARDRLTELTRLKTDNENALNHAREISQLRSRLARRQQAEELKKDLNKTDDEIKHSTPLASAADDVRRVQEINQQIKGLAALPKTEPVPTPSPMGQIALPLSIVLIVVGLILGSVVNQTGFAVAVLGVICLVAYALLPRRQPSVPDPASLKIAELQREADDLANRRGFASPSEFLDAYAQYQQLVDKRQKIVNQLGRVIGDEPTPDALARFAANSDGVGADFLARQDALRALETADLLPEVRAFAFAPDPAPDDLAARQALRRLNEQITELQEHAKKKETSGAQLVALLGQPRSTQEDLDALDEELAEATERQKILERRLEAVQKAITTIQEAKNAVMTSVAAQIQPAIGARLTRVTAERYSDVQVNPNNLSVTVALPGTDRFVGADRLSRGTRDQIYLAARLALIDHVCNDCRPPLIVDDGLVSFDDVRAERMLEILRDFAHDRQVLLFTWSDRYSAHADQVINLSSPDQAIAPA